MKTGSLPPRYIGPFENCRIKSVRRTPKKVEVMITSPIWDGRITFSEVYAVYEKNPEGMFFLALAEYENSGPGRYFEFPNSREDDASFAVEAEEVRFKGN